jgi:hypothetical protein
MQYLKSYQNKKKKKFRIFSPILFYFFVENQKNNKDMLIEKEMTSNPSMQGKTKHVLVERDLEYKDRKAAARRAFNCHPKKLSAKVSQDNKRKYGG